MKRNLILSCILLMAFFSKAQLVMFNPKKIVIGTDVKIKVVINEPETIANYQVLTDIGGDKILPFSSDAVLSLGAPLKTSICHLAVQFDTLTRYYQVFVAPKSPSKNVYERPFLTYPARADILTEQLKKLTVYLGQDTLPVPAASYILSLQVYPKDNSSCLLTFGQYEFLKDLNNFKMYLKKTFEKVYPEDLLLCKLLNEIIASPPLIAAAEKIDAPAIDNLTPTAPRSVAFTTSDNRTLTWYFKMNQ